MSVAVFVADGDDRSDRGRVSGKHLQSSHVHAWKEVRPDCQDR